VSPSRKLIHHRSGSPTDSPRQRRRKNEKDSHLHTNKLKQQEQKFERLCLTRLIGHDPKDTNSRHVNASSEITDTSLLEPTTNHFKEVISQVKLINNNSYPMLRMHGNSINHF
jgi:hypothetical protein